MATITVTIAADGTPTPSNISVNVGDTVHFAADADTVLCVDPVLIFGGERYEIPSGNSVDLAVLSSPPSGFQYITRMGDLSATCDGGRDKTGGGGGGPG